MIQCTGCNISYSPGYAICPRCGTTTPFAPRRSYLETAAVRRVHASESPPLVVADLVVNSFSEVEAEEIVRVAVKKLRRENRRYGVLRSLVGTAMVVFVL